MSRFLTGNRLAAPLGETTTREKTAIAAIVAGAAVAIAGAVFYTRARRSKVDGMSGGLGRIKGRTNVGGMALTHHYDPKMPIKQRVGLLQELVWKGVNNPQMRHLALAITGDGESTVTVGSKTLKVKGAGCPARDGLCEAEAIDRWVRRNVRYTGDVAPVKMGADGPVEGVDLFQGAWRTVEFGGGDCDDHSVVNSTLLILNGIPAKFRITAPRKTSDWAHIYAMAGVPKTGPRKFVAMDTTLPGNMFGREAPHGKKIDFIA